ncbi:hypothetical protein SAMN05421874_101105 [Nonomuraea maritima]|uniref:Uncharacterized protein n=1 Tax=Nonomuraea maritima TaxID=683260 RepID=A0A1G8RYC6_9ACTN|nr:hypothetical protein SAMN05421874_101105 [Nonomuraea maritima]
MRLYAEKYTHVLGKVLHAFRMPRQPSGLGDVRRRGRVPGTAAGNPGGTGGAGQFTRTLWRMRVWVASSQFVLAQKYRTSIVFGSRSIT